MGNGTYSAQSSSGFYLNVRPNGVIGAADIAANLPVEVVGLEAPPAPASNRFVSLHASVDKYEELRDADDNVVYQEQLDEEGDPVLDDYGNVVYKTLLDENGDVLLDEYDQPVFDPVLVDVSYEGFITAALYSSYPLVVANRNAVETRTLFHFMEMGDGTARIQVAKNSDYLKAEGGGGGDVVQGNLQQNSEWATFKVIRGLPMLNDDEVMFRTANNHYLNITPERGLEATATTYGEETVFRVAELEEPHSLPKGEVTIVAKSTQNYLRTYVTNGMVRAKYNEPTLILSDFNLINNEDSSIYLQSTFGTYFTALNGGGELIRHDVNTPGIYERFEVVSGLPGLGENEVLLRSESGNYLKIGDNDWIEATAMNYEDAEVFVIAQKVVEIPQEIPVAIRHVSTGNYLSHEKHGGKRYIDRDSNGFFGDGETFTMLLYDNGNVQFKTPDEGNYLRVEETTHYYGITQNFLRHHATEAHLYETFEMIGSWEEDSVPLPIKLKVLGSGECLDSYSLNYSLSLYSTSIEACTALDSDFEIIDLSAFPILEMVHIKAVPNPNQDGLYLDPGEGYLQAGIPYAYVNIDPEDYSFLMSTYADGSFSLKGHYGHYCKVYRQQDTSWAVKCNASNDQSSETRFFASDAGNGQVTISSVHLGNNMYFKSTDAGYSYVTIYNIDMDGVLGYSDTLFQIYTLEQTVLASYLLVDNRLVIPVLDTGISEMFTLENLTGATMSVTNFGTLDSITGIADLPSLPDIGLLSTFSSLGGFSSPAGSPVRVEVSYVRGNELRSNFPLDNNLKYFDFKVITGASMEIGNMSLASPGSSETEIAIDHRSPSVFFYTDLPIISTATAEAIDVEPIAFGISGKANIPFNPLIADMPSRSGNPAFNGTVWLYGGIGLPGIPENLEDYISATLDANVIIDVDPAAMMQGSPSSIPFVPTNAIKQLGANGSLSAELNLCGENGSCSFSIDLATASLILNTEDLNDPWLAFSGRVEPSEPINLPFGLKIPVNGANVSLAVDTYIDTSNPYANIACKISDFAGLPGVKLEGSFAISKSEVGFAGLVKLGPFFKVSISGSSEDGFKGEMTQKFGTKDWKAEVNVTVTILLGENDIPDVGLSARGKGCVAGKCDSVGASASIESDGRLRVCANIPGIGKKCDKI
ncbi:MAG TPA: hypothetical protein EYP59_15535 [Thiotrichaceae bacterium]|nr:hypothetical protein [Thiotrichaceae bacterium]